MSSPLSRLTTVLADRYRIERELGRGGMATVYLAHDRKHDRRVAIKLLSGDNPWAQDPQRFLREIRLAAQLSHPHILGLIDSGAEGDLLYYTMPFVDGETLRRRLERQRPLPIATAVAILRQVATALAHAHDRGIVHRDVKPENVLLTGDVALVADFGIAKDLDPQAADHAVTTAGVSIGTPGYMAPEQAAADPVIDRRADVYAWGAVAYEVLTGSVLFPGRTPAATLAAQIAERPPPPATHRPNLPPALDALVMRCLAKDPAARPQGMDDVLQQLDTIDLRPRRVVPRWSRTAAVAVAVLIVAALAIVLTRGGPTAPEPAGGALRSLAVLPFALLGGDSAQAHFAFGMSEALTTGLSNVPGLRVSAPHLATGGADRDPVAVAQALGVEAVLGGILQRSGSRVRVTAWLTRGADGSIVWSDQLEREWADVFQLQDEFSQAIVSALRIPLTRGTAPARARVTTADTAAYNQYLLGRLHLSRRTAASLRTAQAHFERSIARDSSFALAWAGLADTWLLLPAYEGIAPTEAYRIARDAARRAITLDSALAEPHTALALIAAVFDRDWTAARQGFARAIVLQPDYPTAHHWRGIMLALQGESDSAVAAFEHAQTLDPTSRVIVSQLSVIYLLARRYDDAVTQGRRGRALDSLFARAHYELAWAETVHGDYADAERSFVRAGELIGDTLPLERTYVEAARGDTARARRRMRALERCCIDPSAVGRFGFEYGAAALAAWTYGILGERDNAFRVLDDGARHRINPGFVRLDPRFDPLRDDPRFTRLLEGASGGNGGRP